MGQSVTVLGIVYNKGNKFRLSPTIFVSVSSLSFCSLHKKDKVKLKLKLFVQRWEIPVLIFTCTPILNQDTNTTSCITSIFIFQHPCIASFKHSLFILCEYIHGFSLK